VNLSLETSKRRKNLSWKRKKSTREVLTLFPIFFDQNNERTFSLPLSSSEGQMAKKWKKYVREAI
jgi:hypothetical protein